MPSVPRHVTKWAPDWILHECKQFAQRENFSAEDIETYNVKYDDCAMPWILCRHKNSPDPPRHFFENFGRIPVRARSYVRGAISFPAPLSGSGYNSNDMIAVFTKDDFDHHNLGSFEVLLHETGHSLDSHAFDTIAGRKVVGAQLSQTKEWLDSVRANAKVSDTYGATTMAENVAQMTVISAYDLNVPGQFKSVQPDWKDIRHTLELMRREQHNNGDLLIPGGTCKRRLANSPPVPVKGKATRRSQVDVEAGSDDESDLIEPNILLGGGPSRRSEMPDVSLAEGLEVIPPSTIRAERMCKH